MNTPACQRHPLLKDRFTWYEKLVARVCLVGAVLAAAAAMYQESAAVAVGYLAFVAMGGILVIYDCLCVYCPYPFQYSDCLFFPHQLLASLKQMRGGRMGWGRKAASAMVFGGIFAVPQYWLWGNWAMFALFWALTAPLALLFPLHLCPRCRHEQCPMNQAITRLLLLWVALLACSAAAKAGTTPAARVWGRTSEARQRGTYPGSRAQWMPSASFLPTLRRLRPCPVTSAQKPLFQTRSKARPA